MGYRSIAEIDEWKRRDPLVTTRRELAAEITGGELKQMEEKIDAQVHVAIAAAKRADWARFNDIVAMNWSGEYAAVVEFMSGETSSFSHGQSEALPGPF
jgi:TPP-dependent pyruvate/acetoin dehydrogenase alpha subunit